MRLHYLLLCIATMGVKGMKRQGARPVGGDVSILDIVDSYQCDAWDVMCDGVRGIRLFVLLLAGRWWLLKDIVETVACIASLYVLIKDCDVVKAYACDLNCEVITNSCHLAAR